MTYREPTPNDAEYYFGVEGGKRMEEMSPPELWHKFAEAYQLAGALLIGADITEERNGVRRNINGWTDDEVDRAIEVILNFLSRPADVSLFDLKDANEAFHAPAEQVVIPVPQSEDVVLQRRSYLAGHLLNLVECTSCKLPRADGLVCPCGWDGSEEDPEYISPASEKDLGEGDH